MRRSFVVVVLSLLLLSGFAFAQNFPAGEISGSYSFARLDQNSNWTGVGSLNAAKGWSATGVANVNRWLGLEANVGGYLYDETQTFSDGLDSVTLTGNEKHLLILGGPRVTYRYKRYEPFGHALFGMDHASVSFSGRGNVLGTPVSVSCSAFAALGTPICGSDNAFAMALGGGLQTVINKHFAVTTGVDYLLTHHGLPTELVNTIQTLTGVRLGERVSQHNVRVTAGIVYRFGFRQAKSTPDPPETDQRMPRSGCGTLWNCTGGKQN
ncbi:MAG: outer membrane beta-barrel protein [Terriglobales bacterium]